MVGDSTVGFGVVVGLDVIDGVIAEVITTVGIGVEVKVGIGEGIFVGVGMNVFVGVGSIVIVGNTVGVGEGIGVVLILGIMFKVGVAQVEAIAIVGPVKLKCSLDPSAPRSSSPTATRSFCILVLLNSENPIQRVV
jgi:hypothetical protein